MSRLSLGFLACSFLGSAALACSNSSSSAGGDCWSHGGELANVRNAFCVLRHPPRTGAKLVCTDFSCDGVSAFEDGCAYSDDIASAGVSIVDACITGTGDTSGTSTDTNLDGTGTTGSTSSQTDGSTSTSSTTSSSTTSTDTGCKSDTDCTDASLPACEVASGQCKVCLENIHCPDAQAAVCDVEQSSCVQCLESSDCVGSVDGEVCDTTTNTCVECLASSDCSAPTAVCDLENSSCVACLTNDDCTAVDTPVCDLHADDADLAPACVPCSQYEGQCNTGVCQAWGDAVGAGECFSLERYVDPVLCKTVTPDGSKEAPFCTLTSAWTLLPPNTSATIYLLGDQPHSVPAPIKLIDNRRLAIIGASAALPRKAIIEGPGPTVETQLFTVEEGSVLILDRVQINKSASALVSIGDIWLRQAEIKAPLRSEESSPSGTGLAVFAGNAWLTGSKVTRFARSGLIASGRDVRLRIDSSMIIQNGDSNLEDAGGIRVSNSANVDVTFSTIADNVGKNEAKQVWCDTSARTLNVRSSLVLGGGDEAIGAQCAITSFSMTMTAHDDDDLKSVATNYFEASSDVYKTWFVDSGPAADYHLDLAKSASIAEVATVAEGDPAIDIDGDLMPEIGQVTHPGADLPQ